MQYLFESAAKRGLSPPEGLNPAEIVLYEQLRTIYALYDLGRIDISTAKHQKRGAEKRYRELDAIWTTCDRLTRKNTKMWRQLDRLASEYRTCDRGDNQKLVNIADKILQEIYGLEK